MAPSPLPVPNSTKAFWRTEPHPLDNHRSTPALPARVDIAIIGAGYAGASVAYHMLRQCEDAGAPLPSLLILEAREACSGATGRNGGHLKPDPYNRPAALAQTHGPAVAAECAAFETATLAAVKRAVERERIACDLVLTRAVDALMTDAMAQRAGAAVALLRGAGVNVDDVFYEGDPAKAQRLSGVRGARACVSYTAGHLWPYKLVLALLQRAVDAGANLQTHTPVAAVSDAPDGDGYYTLTTTARGCVRARKIVHAANGYTSSILREFAGRIVPVRGLCARIVAARQPTPLLPHSYMVRWSPTEYEYMVPRLDGSVVVGGARSRFYHDLGCWYDSVGDDALITTGAAHRYFDGYMQRHFCGWEDSGAYTENVWTGIMGYSSDNCPFVGAVPGRPNQFILAGFTGHGMPQVFLSARGVAKMALDGADFESSGVPRIYKATKERLESDRNATLETWAAHTSASTKL